MAPPIPIRGVVRTRRLRGGAGGQQPVPGDAERRGDRRLGNHQRALHLAPRAGLRLSDHVSAAVGANLWFEWAPGNATGLLGRDAAKDNGFAQLVVR